MPSCSKKYEQKLSNSLSMFAPFPRYTRLLPAHMLCHSRALECLCLLLTKQLSGVPSTSFFFRGLAIVIMFQPRTKGWTEWEPEKEEDWINLSRENSPKQSFTKAHFSTRSCKLVSFKTLFEASRAQGLQFFAFVQHFQV